MKCRRKKPNLDSEFFLNRNRLALPRIKNRNGKKIPAGINYVRLFLQIIKIIETNKTMNRALDILELVHDWYEYVSAAH